MRIVRNELYASVFMPVLMRMSVTISRPQDYESIFSCLTQLSMKFVLLINLRLLTIANAFLLNIGDHEKFSVDKCEILTVVGIFIFIGRENFMLSWVENENVLKPWGQVIRSYADTAHCI